jgi:hypothetical protein
MNLSQGIANRARRGFSRRTFLRRSAAVGAFALAAGALPAQAAAAARAGATVGADLVPHPAVPTLLDALRRFPLLGVAELHFLQEWHDVMHALLFHPALPPALTDIVVEFGNAQYQDLADRFILEDQPVAKADLAQIWRFQGWDAPVYEEFLRTVRAVNWMRPRGRRIRVLLGAPPFDVPAVHSANDAAFRRWWQSPIDAYCAVLVEREVLQKGRRALLLAGGGHLMRGINADRNVPNLATRLSRRHPGALFVVDTVAVRPGRPQVTGLDDATARRLQAAFVGWPRPSIAPLAGSWLAAEQAMADRAITPAAAQYGRQADAILYLGPGSALTASQTWPEIFQAGRYRAQLQRLNPIVSQIDGTHEDLIAESLHWAEAGPSWWTQFG